MGDEHFIPDTGAEKKLTKFDIQLATLLEIRELLTQNNTYSTESLIPNMKPEYLQAWLCNIKSVYREISMLLSDKEIEEIDNSINAIKKLPQVTIIKHNKYNEPIQIINKKAFYKTWNALDFLDRKVRKQANEKGMLVKFRDSVFD